MEIKDIPSKPFKYWNRKYAMIVMAHTKCGTMIVRALLDRGVRVMAVSPYLRQTEVMRSQMTPRDRRHFRTYQCDLHSITATLGLIREIKLELGEIDLLICLLPQLVDEDSETLLAAGNETLLQMLLEIDELSAKFLTDRASKILLPNGHVWTIRYNHNEADLVVQYFLYLLNIGKCAARSIDISLINKIC